MSIPTDWVLLRTKTDETVDDTDWVGTNSTTGLAAASDPMAISASFQGKPYTGVEIVVAAVANGTTTLQNRTGTVDLTLVETVTRSIVGLGGTLLAADMNVDADPSTTTGIPMQRKVYFPLNGATNFTIRITNDSGTLPANCDLQIWWRSVTR